MRIVRAVIAGFKPTMLAIGLFVVVVNLIQNVVRGTDYMDFLVVSVVLLFVMVLTGSYVLDKVEKDKLDASEMEVNIIVGPHIDYDLMATDLTRFLSEEKWRWRIEEET